jgi:LysR family glycine cleavage system transcriptional activator
MRRLLPSMTSLRVFESAARHLSFSEAALDLDLTQSAVSRQIRALESLLSAKLFLRGRQRLKLTEAGAAYLPEVRTCLSRLEAATLQLLTHQGSGGVLNVAILPTFGARWLIPRMPAFWAANPQIMVHFVTRTAALDFAIEESDCAIHFGDPMGEGILSYRLMGEDVVTACAPRLRSKLRLRKFADLEKHTLLQHTTRPNAWPAWLTAAGTSLAQPLKGPRFEHISLVIQAAIAGIGVAVLPRFLIEDELASGRLVMPFELEVRSHQAYYLVYPQDKQHMPAVVAFRDWLLVEAERARSRTTETAGA